MNNWIHREKPITGDSLILALGVMGLLMGLLWLQPNAIPLVRAATYRVPDDYPTIQAAIDAAAHGDIIQVAEGLYTENLVITKSITLQGGWSTDFLSRNPEAHVTTINGNRAGSVMLIWRVCTPTVEGFVITGGDATGLGGGPYGNDGDGGAGIHIHNASPTILNNVIVDNIASTTRWGDGGGILVNYPLAGPPVISGNLIISNVACLSSSISYTGEGGGICVVYGSAIIVGNQVISNVASTGKHGQGGGICIFDSDGVTVQGNVIRGNVASTGADGSGGGGGLYLYFGGDHRLVDNQVLDNVAGPKGYGGGIRIEASSRDVVENNIIRGNVASTASAWGEGGGVYVVNGGDVTVRGNTIRDNAASAWDYERANHPDAGQHPIPYACGGGIYVDHAQDPGVVLIDDNEIFGNVASRSDIGIGGGLLASGEGLMITRNVIRHNVGSIEYRGRSGGLHVDFAHATVSSNWILDNATSASDRPLDWGGGAVMSMGVFTVTNNVVARNTAEAVGGLYVYGLATLTNNTLADNDAERDDGLVIGPQSLVTLTNNIIVSQTVGLVVFEGATATLSCTLWHGNDQDKDIKVPSAVTEWRSVHGDPRFVNPLAGDYHIGPDSAAINAGIAPTADAATDIDGDARPDWCFPDLGADEFITGWGCTRFYLPLAFRSHAL